MDQQRIQPETAPSQTARHARPEVESTFKPSTSESERVLAGIWQELLGIREIGVDDNFFDLGGDSLLAAQLISKINKSLHFDLSVPVLFQNPTIKKLATIFDQENHDPSEPKLAKDNASDTHLITFQSKGSRPPLFFLHGDWAGGGLYCARLSQHLGEDQPFYSLPPYRSGEQRVLKLEEMVDYHLAIIRKHTPHGPYLLGGYCAGATIAMEIGRKLVEQGEKVPYLLLLDLPRRAVPWLRKVWSYVDKGGDILKWDLLKKIQFFDRYPVSLSRWINLSFRSKLLAIGRRLGLTTAGSSSQVTMGLDAGAYDLDLEILKSLDYAVYFLAVCLHPLIPLSIPATLYFAQETLPRSVRVKRANEIFSMATVEMVPGNHHTCITKYASVLADEMKKTLCSLSSSHMNSVDQRPDRSE
jgi:acyl carrier protein